MHIVAYSSAVPLRVPPSAFNGDGIAAVILTGTRYGGEWVINACIGAGESPTVIGSVETGRTDDPDVAAETALAWVAEECARLGLTVAHVVNCNDRYGPDERPYFTTSQVLVVNQDWT
jgi:hypothetical protein